MGASVDAGVVLWQLDYGSANGEIVKGIVTLGSQRQYQDYSIFEGLMAPHETGNDRTNELTDVVYARLRQLAAHEVGHTLGLEHNYIASTRGRASVMDYPGPQIDIRPEGGLDLSHAYAVALVTGTKSRSSGVILNSPMRPMRVWP